MATLQDHRAPIIIALLVFIPVACFEKDCGPTEIACEGDRSCPAGSACRQDTDGCGDVRRTCVAVTECTSDADCPEGITCAHRQRESAEHPFEHDVAERGVCGCDDEETTCRPFQPTASSAASGGGGGGDTTVAQVSVSTGSATTQAATGAGGDGGTSGADGGGGAGGDGGAQVGGGGGAGGVGEGGSGAAGGGGAGGGTGGGGAPANGTGGAGGAG